ncbi:hypothetical protein [Micromonospora sp. LOL_015]|uniref:hypothetical protein n=1 Tax=Micromonospora sp. LOL_015 TaxID=3345416 RepID=UPI003A870DF0
MRIFNKIGEALLERLVPRAEAQAAPCPCGYIYCQFCIAPGYRCRVMNDACTSYDCYLDPEC